MGCALSHLISWERLEQKGLSLKLISNYLGSEERIIDSAGWKEPKGFMDAKLQSLSSAHSRSNSLYPLPSTERDLDQHFTNLKVHLNHPGIL